MLALLCRPRLHAPDHAVTRRAETNLASSSLACPATSRPAPSRAAPPGLPTRASTCPASPASSYLVSPCLVASHQDDSRLACPAAPDRAQPLPDKIGPVGPRLPRLALTRRPSHVSPDHSVPSPAPSCASRRAPPRLRQSAPGHVSSCRVMTNHADPYLPRHISPRPAVARRVATPKPCRAPPRPVGHRLPCLTCQFVPDRITSRQTSLDPPCRSASHLA